MLPGSLSLLIPLDRLTFWKSAFLVLKRIFAIRLRAMRGGDDLDRLRPGVSSSLTGRLPDTGADLCSQPTVFELGEKNAPSLFAISSRLHCAVSQAR